jgi:arsenite-transporting ATPase
MGGQQLPGRSGPHLAAPRLRAIGELPQIDKVRNEHGTRLGVVPMLPTERVGIPALEALSRTRVALTR